MKTQSTKHTPTPWEIGEKIGTGELVVTFEARDICTVDNRDGIANAEFIVRAVNSHEELLEACKALLHVYEQVPADNIDQATDQAFGNLRAANQARAAIAKAAARARYDLRQREN